MTGSQTDRVAVPQYAMAVTLLLRLSSPLFHAAMRERNGVKYLDESTYQHYSSLRDAVQHLLQERATSLPPMLRVNMLRALNVAHHLGHQLKPSPEQPVTECECEVAETIRMVSLKLRQPQEQLELLPA